MHRASEVIGGLSRATIQMSTEAVAEGHHERRAS